MAIDDLSYFPHAVTASGLSVMTVQQQQLQEMREQRRL